MTACVCGQVECRCIPPPQLTFSQAEQADQLARAGRADAAGLLDGLADPFALLRDIDESDTDDNDEGEDDRWP